MSDIAISIEHVSKEYRLGAIGGGTLSADIQSWWARKHGKEDPNVKIGIDQSKAGERFKALDDVSLEVQKGEALGVIGANGAGKSTLLKLLSRVTAPTSGQIGINGRITSMLEVGTGFHPELTGRENIYMNGAILGMTKREIDAKIDEIIEFSECAQFIDTPVKRYSSGMYVKLGFSVASHLESEIMIIDEVLAVGDMKFQSKCLGSMGQSAQQGDKTILYVSHNMATIRQLCSRCVVLDHGHLIFDGPVEEAIEVYMDRDDTALVSYYDLSGTERPSLDHGRDIHIESFEFLNGSDGVFEDEDKIRFRVRWHSDIAENHMMMYLPVKYSDSTAVGLAESAEFPNGGAGSDNTAEFEFDISNLAAGKYYFFLNFYNVNEFGTHRSYDHPNRNIYFEIVRNKHDGIEWQRKFWGSVKLNPVIPV